MEVRVARRWSNGGGPWQGDELGPVERGFVTDEVTLESRETPGQSATPELSRCGGKDSAGSGMGGNGDAMRRRRRSGGRITSPWIDAEEEEEEKAAAVEAKTVEEEKEVAAAVWAWVAMAVEKRNWD
ncbi:hypothetical protein PIB30_055135 [Stylosanthes scabra]|uniref:Uncharacterized protein n=1 Tax=Stylosanthes scabra TaxID=79078 RepID=A0ABU6ZHP3_9FABA|nr:hypothetical protein [Stylosanthes scabra]